MTDADNALSITLAGAPDLPGEVYAALYRITGRSTVELRRAVRATSPVYSAPLFGSDHLSVVPRLEKTATYLDDLGLPFVVHEWVDGDAVEITRETMREILEGTDGQYA